MITIAGFNTSIDAWLEVDTLVPSDVVRVRDVGSLPGGKGLHVAVTCATLGEAVRLVGIVDCEREGFVGEFLEDAGVIFRPVEIEGKVRGCIAVHERTGRTTELLEPGPQIGPADVATLELAALCGVGGGDLVVFSGSLPKGYPTVDYRALMERAKAAGARTMLDASGAVLREGMGARPDFVKVNREEAAALTGLAVSDRDGAKRAARALVERGAGSALITLGGDGVVMATASGGWTVRVPTTDVRSAVGAGDCLLGGLAVGLARRLPQKDLLRLGGACGAAKTLRVESGMLHLTDVEALQDSVQVEAWDT